MTKQIKVKHAQSRVDDRNAHNDAPITQGTALDDMTEAASAEDALKASTVALSDDHRDDIIWDRDEIRKLIHSFGDDDDDYGHAAKHARQQKDAYGLDTHSDIGSLDHWSSHSERVPTFPVEEERREPHLTSAQERESLRKETERPVFDDFVCPSGPAPEGELPAGQMDWAGAMGWKAGTGPMTLTLSGEINQAALDSPTGINNQAWAYFFHAKAQAWKQINKTLGTSFSEDTNFTFLPAITYTITQIACNTNIDVPVLLVAPNIGRQNPTFKIDPGADGVFDISGQIVYAVGFINVYVYSGLFTIERAMFEVGDFYISKGASYFFGGKAPDTTPLAGVSVSEKDLRYFNGNKAGVAFWAQVIDKSTIYLQGGKTDTSDTGLIVINSEATFEVQQPSQIGGQVVVGWDRNLISLKAKVTLLPNAKIVASADVDFGGIGFDGTGLFVVAGSRWDAAASGFVAPAVHAGNGATIGNITVGYNALFDLGIGGSPTVMKNDMVNPEPNFGGSMTFDGKVTFTGTFSIGGGNNIDGVATISAQAELVSGSAEASISVANANGVITVGDNADVGVPLVMEDGRVNCGLGDTFGNVVVHGGTFTAGKQGQFDDLTLSGGVFDAKAADGPGNAITLANIVQTGGEFKGILDDGFGNVTVSGTIFVNGGTFAVTCLKCAGDVTISGSGAARFGLGSSLNNVIVDTIGDVSLYTVSQTLTIGEHATGITTVKGATIPSIDVKGGTLRFNQDSETITTLTISGGVVDAGDKGGIIGTVSMSGGRVVFKSLTVNDALSVAGGTFTVATLTCDPLLSVTGTGSVHIESGTLNAVSICSSGTNVIGASFTSLTLEHSDIGTTSLTAGTLSNIQVKDGKLVFAASTATVDSLDVSGGEVSDTGVLTVNTLTISGGKATFNELHLPSQAELDVGAGALSVRNMTYSGVLNISGSGSVDVDDGRLETVIVNSIADCSFGENSFPGMALKSLSLGAQELGSVTLGNISIGEFAMQAGTLAVSGDVVFTTSVDLSGGVINVTKQLGIDTSQFKSIENATINLDGGSLIIGNDVDVTSHAKLLVSANGGEIGLGKVKTSRLTLSSDIEVNGTLRLIADGDEGSGGTVVLAHDVTGKNGVIDVASGVECDVKNEKTNAIVKVDANGKLIFGEGYVHQNANGGVVYDDKNAFWVKEIDIEGGAASAPLEVRTSKITVNGGTASFNAIVIEHELYVSSGKLSAQLISSEGESSEITGDGSVDLENGRFTDVVYSSSGSSIFGTFFGKLTIPAGTKGSLDFINKIEIHELDAEGGSITVSGQAKILSNFTLAHSNLTITGELIDQAATSVFAASSRVTLNGGVIRFEHTGEVSFDGAIAVGAEGGKIATVAGAAVKITHGLQLDGALKLDGAGSVFIGGVVTGSGIGDVINVGTGVTLIIEADAVIAPQINVAAGAHIVFTDGASSSATLNISDSAAKEGCTICFDDAISELQTAHIQVHIKNFGDGVKLDLRNLKMNGVRIEKAYYAAGKIHVIYEVVDAQYGEAGERELIFDDVSGAGLYDNEMLTIEDDGTGGTDIETCFLEGTLIETLEGWRQIETLSPGDRVWTYCGNNREESAVRWVGYGDVTCRPDQPDDLAGYAVRIKQDAISPGVPSADVLVTSEHCLYLDGGLIPARMLVNGSSISYAYDRTTYRFYHFETDRHAVVSASHLKAETYLDTGNRRRFAAGRGVMRLQGKIDADRVAPLKVSVAEVEPIYYRLAQRCVVDHPLEVPSSLKRGFAATTRESDFHVRLPDGRALAPVEQRDSTLIFNIPQGVRSVMLTSRASRPCDAIGPYVDDRRTLGVLVGNITYVAARRHLAVRDHLTSSEAGWYGHEDGTCRWTNGCARLVLPEVGPSDEASLSATYAALHVEIRAQGPYLVNVLDPAEASCVEENTVASKSCVG